MKRSRLNNMANVTILMMWTDFDVRVTLLLNSPRLCQKGLSSTKIKPPQSGSKSFWNICKPMFSNNVNNIAERLILAIISDERKIAQFFQFIFLRYYPITWDISLGRKIAYKHPRNHIINTVVSNLISRNFKLIFIRNGFQIRIPRPKICMC